MTLIRQMLSLTTFPSHILCWLSAGFLLLTTAPALSAELPYCSDIYSNGLQTFGNNSYIRFDYNAHIANPSSTALNTARVENHPWSIRTSCATDACSVSGITTPRPRDNRRLKTSATAEVLIPAHKKITLGANNVTEFRRVQVEEWGTAVFSPDHKVYIIDQLDVGYKSSVRLTAGEYWIHKLNLEVESRIDVLGEGTVHLYVINPLQVPLNVKLNANNADSSQLSIYTYGRAEFHAGTQTYGFVRAESELYLHHRAKISGGAIARIVDMGTESQVAYDAAAAQKLNIPRICRAAPPVEPGDTTPPNIFLLGSGDTTQRNIRFHAVVRDTGDNASGLSSVMVKTPLGEFPMQEDGRFYVAELTLVAGENMLTVVAVDHAGNRSEATTIYTFLSPPTLENLSYPNVTVREPLFAITGEVHSYWPAEDLTLLVADKPVALIPVTEGIYRFAAVVELNASTTRFSIYVENKVGEYAETEIFAIYHPSVFDITVDQHDQETSADTITLTGRFNIPGEEYNTQVIRLIIMGDSIAGELPVTIDEMNSEYGRFSVQVPLEVGENYFVIRVINTLDDYPWEGGATITRTSS